MFKRALLSTLTIVLGITLTTAGVAAAAPMNSLNHHNETVFYAASLAGANEVPAADPADRASVIVRVSGTQVCFAEHWSHLTGPVAAHIHMGAAGVAGPVKVPFWAGAIPTSINAVTGCTTSDAATLAAIKADPAGFYANIHTPLFPAGAARGQLRRIGESFHLQAMFNVNAAGLAAFNDHDSNFAAVAKGANEVPVPGSPDGRALGFFRIGTDTVNFAATWRGIQPPFAAHFHMGAKGVSGPVVVPFFATATHDGLPPTINGVAGSVTAAPDLLTQIRQNPAGFYFNMHTADFPGGVARGQLFEIG